LPRAPSLLAQLREETLVPATHCMYSKVLAGITPGLRALSVHCFPARSQSQQHSTHASGFLEPRSDIQIRQLSCITPVSHRILSTHHQLATNYEHVAQTSSRSRFLATAHIRTARVWRPLGLHNSARDRVCRRKPFRTSSNNSRASHTMTPRPLRGGCLAAPSTGNRRLTPQSLDHQNAHASVP
jgi:hypothetical protein